MYIFIFGPEKVIRNKRYKKQQPKLPPGAGMWSMESRCGVHITVIYTSKHRQKQMALPCAIAI
jgi:hypothetical protein